MVKIDRDNFAKKVEDYLTSPDGFDKDSIIDTLNIVDPSSQWKERRGITFGYNTKLMMQLIARSYSYVQMQVTVDDFSEEIAKIVAEFAQPFPNHENLCYPHFLFHGLAEPTLDRVVDRLRNNVRIIHETLGSKKKIIKDYQNKTLCDKLKVSMSNGCTDDYFGIAYLLAKQESHPTSVTGYIAKASFFVDETKREIYVITLQGRRFGSNDPVRAAHPSGQERKKEAEQEYARIGNILGMSPRRFILTQVMDFGKHNGFQKIKVIKPQEHPMSIERHDGFYGNYESVVRKAGINEENGCHLEARL